MDVSFHMFNLFGSEHCLRRYLTPWIIPQSHFLRSFFFFHRKWIFQVLWRWISPMLSVWTMMQPSPPLRSTDACRRNLMFAARDLEHVPYKNRCADLFHMANTLGFKWTDLDMWFADLNMYVHFLSIKTIWQISLWDSMKTMKQRSHLDLPCPNGMVSAMRHGKSCRFQSTTCNSQILEEHQY